MSYPDYRALCAELLQPLAEYDGANPYHEHRALITRARAALAQPEAVGPTDEESFALWEQMESGMNEPPDWRDFDDFARAVLARWGSPNPTTATTPTP